MDKGDVIVVTGAARRLGRELSLFLAGKGCRLVLHCNKSVDEAGQLCRELQEAGTPAAVVAGDLQDTDGLEALFGRFVEPFGRVDALVNGASRFERRPIESVDPETWRQDMALHAAAPFFLSRYLYLHLLQRGAGGAVVNITDTLLSGPTASRPSYFCSKGALSAETAPLAVALAPVVRVNEVAPGPVLAADDGTYFRKMAGRLPLRRCGTPSDFCQAVWYLLDAPFVTGQVLQVDGGQHLL
jgi:NAD(P)-dependent dehydrogenase (short-subunit alcohol dehydrogenase family)